MKTDMKTAIDSDVIIRFLTGDDPNKQSRSAKLLRLADEGSIQLSMPHTVIADIVFVLASPRLYHVPRTKICDMLTALLEVKELRIASKNTVLLALKLYAIYTIDFGDAMLIAHMNNSKIDTIYSYDHDFDKIKSIKRIEP